MKQLTQREVQILKLIVKGKTQKEIANSLDLSFHTVKTYVQQMKNKLQVTRNIELANIAILSKIVQ